MSEDREFGKEDFSNMFKDISDNGNFIRPQRIKQDTPQSDKGEDSENVDSFSSKMQGKENSARRKKAERKQ